MSDTTKTFCMYWLTMVLNSRNIFQRNYASFTSLTTTPILKLPKWTPMWNDLTELYKMTGLIGISRNWKILTLLTIPSLIIWFFTIQNGYISLSKTSCLRYNLWYNGRKSSYSHTKSLRIQLNFLTSPKLGGFIQGVDTVFIFDILM